MEYCNKQISQEPQKPSKYVLFSDTYIFKLISFIANEVESESSDIREIVHHPVLLGINSGDIKLGNIERKHRREGPHHNCSPLNATSLSSFFPSVLHPSFLLSETAVDVSHIRND